MATTTVGNVTRPGGSLSAIYVHDDPRRREEFDHELACFVRRHGEGWDVTSIVEPLELLGRRVERVRLNARREPTGAVSVTFTFELPPGPAAT